MPDAINTDPDFVPADMLRDLRSERLDPLFWPNARAGIESAWTKHVPFAHWIVATHQPRCLVELGTHNGVSYVAFCEAAQRARLDCRCFAIDTWMGDEHAGFYNETVYAELKKAHDQRYSGFSELLRCTFDQALPSIADNTVDLLHIDGLHTYDAARHDFDTWRPKLTRRAVVLFHDTNVRQREFGVWRLWQELRADYPGFEFYHGHGLGVLLVGDRCGPELRALASLSPDVAGTVRERFSFLGERWDGEMRLAVAEKYALAGIQAKDRERHAEAERAQRAEAHAAHLQAALDREREAAAHDRAQHERERTQATAGQARILLEEKRLRARAAQRSAEARAEAASLRVQLAELPVLQDRCRELGDAYAKALHAVDHARAEAASAEHKAALLRDQVVALTTQREIILASTSWRMTGPFRRVANAIPRPVRSNARRLAQLSWWIMSNQLGRRLRQRKRLRTDARTIAACPLFDPAWYVHHNPDVAASGMEPSFHYALAGGNESRDPGPGFSVAAYWAQHPEAATAGRPALLHFIETGQPLGWPVPAPSVEPAGQPTSRIVLPAPDPAPLPPPSVAQVTAAPAEPEMPTLAQLLARRWPFLEPLRTYAAPHDKPRVTIVTDSIGSGSLYGGVGTALILAALLAQRLDASLRLVTRSEAATADNIGTVLALHGIEWTGNIEILYAPTADEGREIPVCPREVMLTTSWWTTWAARRSVSPSRIVYLLQEDERGFYPLGDDHRRCTEVLTDPDITFVVNSGLLMGHLRAEGLAPGGISFDPAFPLSIYHDQGPHGDEKHNFFFYARPNNVRNLFWRGLEAVGTAIEEGILPTSQWTFHFVGKDIPPLRLPGGIQPVICENLPWAGYASLVRRMDLGLSLMDTPHPSYPPLDLAASGAVVVTNRFGPKTTLDRFSRNIVCADGTVRGLVEGLRQAKALALDRPQRSANYAANAFQRDWSVAMQPVLDRLSTQFGG